MAIELTTQQQVRPLQRVPFCYLCGEPIAGAAANRDHVPPSALFMPEDRTFPLILPTHYKCNHARHVQDQQVGQLVGLLHGRAPDPRHLRLQFVAGRADDGAVAAVGGLDLRDIIRRWVRGFHAALYREPLMGAQFMTFPPLAERDMDTGKVQSVPPLVPEFVRAIRQSRPAGALDRIVIRNGKCSYECGWLRADQGGWFCCYALNLYDWTRLGDSARFGVRGCVGVYVLSDRSMPSGASLCVRPDDTPLPDPLNPFAATP